MKAIFPGLLVLVFGALSVALWLSCSISNSSPATQVTVGTQPVEPIVIRALGYVEPISELRRLAFKTDGVIATCPVEIGQRVRKNDVLMTMRNLDEEASVALAEQELAVVSSEREQLLAGTPSNQVVAAEHKVELIKEQLRHAQVHFDRINPLAEKNAASKAERDQADSDLRRAEQKLKQSAAELAHLKNVVRPEDKLVADAKVKRAEAQLRVARERLADTVLLAPFDGTVLEILRREGEAARLMDRDAVMIFADDSRLRVRAEVDERFVSNLEVAQSAMIYGRALGSNRIEGMVAVVKGVMGPKTVFSRDAAERKDLDVLQVLIDMPASFHAPLGLQVDVDLATVHR